MKQILFYFISTLIIFSHFWFCLNSTSCSISSPSSSSSNHTNGTSCRTRTPTTARTTNSHGSTSGFPTASNWFLSSNGDPKQNWSRKTKATTLPSYWNHFLPTKTHLQALEDPNWNPTVNEEYDALIKNGMWTLVPRPKATNIVRSIWLFRHKFGPDGKLYRYKARLVANCKSQETSINCDENFSP